MSQDIECFRMVKTKFATDRVIFFPIDMVHSLVKEELKTSFFYMKDFQHFSIFLQT